MVTLDEYSYDEQVSIENERRAFQHIQNVHFDFVKQSTPQGSGALAAGLLGEYEQAYADWRDACAVLEQIGREIQTGMRR